MNIILCGLPMSGKTTIGKKLAELLKWDFIDTDRLIENAYDSSKKFTCREIYAKEGERKFRELEKKQIAALKSVKSNVIAVGGGSLSDSENLNILKLCGELIYLNAPVSILWERTQWRGIPAYLDPNDPEKAFYEMAEKRIPLYEKATDYILQTADLSEQEIVEAIINRKEQHYGK